MKGWSGKMKKWGFLALLLIVIAALTVTAMAESGLTITGAQMQENGNVLVKWQDDAKNGPYIVAYQYTDGQEAYSLQVAGRDIKGTSFEITDLAPGEAYLLYVVDQDYNMDDYEFSSSTKLFGGEGSGARLTVTLRKKQGGSVVNVDKFTVSEIESTMNDTKNFCGATIKATLPKLSKSVQGMDRVALKLPNGDMFVFIAQEDKILTTYDYMYFDSVSFNSLWRYIQSEYENIPAGTYTVSYYFNTDYFGYKTFEVTAQ